MRADGNNVDIDTETSRMAATEIYYQGVSQLMSAQFAGLKYQISGGR
jgi:flagellar basal-body rod protein FlgB